MKSDLATSQATAEAVSGHGEDWLRKVSGAVRLAAGKARKMLSALPLPRIASNPYAASSIDTDAIARRLDVDARGRADGQNERPSSDEDTLSGTQAEIVHYFRRLRVRAQERLARLQRQVCSAAEAIDVDDARSRIADLPSRCRNAAVRIKAEFQPRIEKLAERETQQHQYYLAFRERHQLDRIAEESHSPVINIASIAMLIVLATAALSALALPAAESPQLLTSGWALGIAVVVVVLPFTIGAGALRFMNHADALLQLAGWLATLLTVFAIGAVLYAATWYLAYAANDPASTISGALAAMANDPWSPVADFTAWQRTSLVGAASLIALFIGYRADDPYPGYGDVQRAYYRARAERERLVSKLRRRINTMIDNAEAEVVAAADRLKSAIQRLGAAIDTADHFRSRLPDFDGALEDGCNILLDRYRRANQDARSSPPPMSFSEHVCFRSSTEIEPPTANDQRGQWQAIVDSMPGFEKDVVRVRQDLRDLNSQSLYALDEVEAEDNPGNCSS